MDDAPEFFALYEVQNNGDKTLVAQHPTFEDAASQAETLETPSIERVTEAGSTVLL
jgi:hypothetical protein